MEEKDLKELARQLSCPEGAEGLVTAERMNVSNANMTRRTIDAMQLNGNVQVLEIGPGNAIHVTDLLRRSDDIRYRAADISPTMIAEAERLNAAWTEKGRASFHLSDGQTLPFAIDTFDRIFTVNTLYFWQDPPAYATELLRVLKPGARLYLTFAEKSFMEQLPFVQYGFQLYDTPAAEALLHSAGYRLVDALHETETVTAAPGVELQRDFTVVIAEKRAGPLMR